MSCGVGRRRGSDPALLWLWCRLAVGPLAWESPYATSVALKSKKKKEKEKEKKRNLVRHKKCVCLFAVLNCMWVYNFFKFNNLYVYLKLDCLKVFSSICSYFQGPRIGLIILTL